MSGTLWVSSWSGGPPRLVSVLSFCSLAAMALVGPFLSRVLKISDMLITVMALGAMFANNAILLAAETKEVLYTPSPFSACLT